jgi:hypothetical protein
MRTRPAHAFAWAGVAHGNLGNIELRPGTSGNALNYELRAGMHTITLRPQRTSPENAEAVFPLIERRRRMDGAEAPLRFDAPAIVRKWPSINNTRRIDRDPCLVLEGRLDECIREFMAKPPSTRHLY